MSTIFEVNSFLSRKEWIQTKRCVEKARGRNLVPFKWLFKSKEEPDILIRLNYINVVKGYTQVPGVDFTESLLSVASDTSTRILIGLTLYHKAYGWVAELCDVGAEFLHPSMEV